MCASHVGTRYHCILCNDFDLCITCYQKEEHPHIMDKLDANLYGSQFFRSSVLHYYQKQAEAPRSKKFINGINCLLEHSAQCNRCNFPNCQNIKRVLHHGRLCKFKNDGKCPIYGKYFEILKCHCTVSCTIADCPFCPDCHSVHLLKDIKQHQLIKAQSQQIITITTTAKTNEHSTSITNDTH